MGEEECMGGEEVYGGIGSVCRECTLCGGRECVGVSVCGGVCVGGCVLGRRGVMEEECQGGCQGGGCWHQDEK